MSSSDPKKVLNKVLSKAALYILIASGIYLITMVLAVIIHVLFGIAYYHVEYEYLVGFTRYGFKIYEIGVANVDIPTYIIVGAIDLILNFFVSILIGLAAILVWIINAFIIGADENGRELFPVSLFKAIALIPVIGDWFKDVVGISESLIFDFRSALDLLVGVMQSALTPLFTGLSGYTNDIVSGFLGRERTAVIPDTSYMLFLIKNYLNWSFW